jgi:ABC-2 type transport system ATP-binding protein
MTYVTIDFIQLKANTGGLKVAEPFLIAQNLQKSFNSHQAVANVSFSIEKGEIFGLLGPNGAGKTTTIRMLSTVLSPDQGDIIIGGHSVRHDPASARKLIGSCPQDLALYQDLSALDNLVFFGRMEGMSGKDARAQAVKNLDLVGLSDRAKDKVKTFSTGMKRRVNLVVALMGDPSLLFLDEPTVGIDPQSRNNIYDTIFQLRDRGKTILYTTHYMEEADRLCNCIAIMDAGSIVVMDTPDNLKRRIGPPESTSLEDVFLSLTGKKLRD